MTRHSSSFIISLIFHAVLFFLLLYSYENISFTNNKTAEKKVEICLCTVSIENPKKESKKPEPIVQKTVKKLSKEKAVKKTTKVAPKKTKPKVKSESKTIIKKPQVVPVEKIRNQEIKKDLNSTEEATDKKTDKPTTTETEIKSENSEKKELVTSSKVTTKQKLESTEKKQDQIVQEYISSHIQEISKLLRENLYYPRSARKRGIQGKVTVQFTLSKNAEVSNIIILESKNETLSRSAIKTIQNISDKFPKPPENLILNVPINYSLNR